MKKLQRLICLFVSLLLLSGCAVNHAPDTTVDTTGISADTTGVPAETSGVPADRVDGPVQNEVYFAAGNDYYDLYYPYSWMPGPEITLLSSEHIDPESIQVTADIQAEYEFFVIEQKIGKPSLTTYEIIEREGKRTAYELTSDASALPLYLYQTYAGIDWSELGKLYTEYAKLLGKYDVGEVTYDQVMEVWNQYMDASIEYIDMYSQLDPEEFPQYYKYTINVNVKSAEVEEIFTTVHVTIGETVYDVNIGEVRIRPEYVPSTGREYLYMKSSSPVWLNCLPYGSGIERCESETNYAADAITLTGLYFLENLNSSVEVMDVVAFISDDPHLGAGIEIEWDGVTPIYVEQGKYLTFFITFRDDRLKEINYHSKLYPVVEFEHEGTSYERISEIPLYRFYNDTWLLYAMGMGGLDMESYFNDYHYLTINEVWRSDVDLTTWGQKK